MLWILKALVSFCFQWRQTMKIAKTISKYFQNPLWALRKKLWELCTCMHSESQFTEEKGKQHHSNSKCTKLNGMQWLLVWSTTRCMEMWTHEREENRDEKWIKWTFQIHPICYVHVCGSVFAVEMFGIKEITHQYSENKTRYENEENELIRTHDTELCGTRNDEVFIQIDTYRSVCDHSYHWLSLRPCKTHKVLTFS